MGVYVCPKYYLCEIVDQTSFSRLDTGQAFFQIVVDPRDKYILYSIVENMEQRKESIKLVVTESPSLI